MPYQMSSDFQTILDFSTLSHHKKLRELEIDAQINMAQFAADAAKAANDAANASNVKAAIVEDARSLMDLRNELKKLDPTDPDDKIVYDAIKKKMEPLL